MAVRSLALTVLALLLVHAASAAKPAGAAWARDAQSARAALTRSVDNILSALAVTAIVIDLGVTTVILSYAIRLY